MTRKKDTRIKYSIHRLPGQCRGKPQQDDDEPEEACPWSNIAVEASELYRAAWTNITSGPKKRKARPGTHHNGIRSRVREATRK